jgi:Domain of unknown function (DUF3332)
MLKPHMRHPFMVTLIVFLLAFSLLASGCYGSFALTKKLYEFNGAVQDRFVRSIVTAVMILLPVYWFGGAVDWVLFNTIEFWTGKNPMTEEIIKLPSKGKKRSSMDEDLYVQTLYRTDRGLETKLDAYRQGHLIKSLAIHLQEGSPVVTADLRWAETGVSEQYTVQQLADGRVLVGRASSTGERATKLIEAEKVQEITAKLVSLHLDDHPGVVPTNNSSMILGLYKP